jgi:erythromycin esterase
LIAAVLVACSDPTTPVDVDAPAALAWVNQTATPLSALAPTASRTDLEPFISMVGSARIIGLGEATHGSREFFTMKDRLLRHLIEEAGVTGFALEATMPEAFAIDAYVRTGVGNPKVLLSHLYFWTWNTQEVADLIAGLRQWNQEHPTKQVGFYGFDMQYPGVAIDSVTSYIARVAPSLSESFAADYACLASYRNDATGVSAKNYSNAGPAVWQPCSISISDAHTRLIGQHEALVAASSEREFGFALQMAKLVVQWDRVVRSSLGVERDEAMSANVEWLLDREGPSGKLVLWAHNFHVSRYPGAMGRNLTARFGQDYVAVGFGFGSGGLNAIEGFGQGIGGTGVGRLGALGPLTAPAPVSDSHEAVLQGTTSPNYYFDLRETTATSWFNRGHRFRSVGTVYYPQDPEFHYSTVVLRSLYDVMIFIRDVTPSTLLPFQY